MYTPPRILPSNLTFAQMIAKGASGHLEANIAQFQGANPAGTPTITPTGGGTTGGSLPAGTYYVVLTETNGIGETMPSTETSFTIAAGNIPQLGIPPIQAGNSAWNIYIGTSPGQETLYMTGTSTDPLNLTTAIPTDSRANCRPPSADGIAPDTRQVNALKAATDRRLQSVWDQFSRAYTNWNAGEPMDYMQARQEAANAALVFGTLAQVANELGAAIDANPGHYNRATPTAIGGTRTRRIWP